jgi:hypothetical protein
MLIADERTVSEFLQPAGRNYKKFCQKVTDSLFIRQCVFVFHHFVIIICEIVDPLFDFSFRTDCDCWEWYFPNWCRIQSHVDKNWSLTVFDPHSVNQS